MSEGRHFHLTEQHVSLLRNFGTVVWSDCEAGAPAIDPKRPYGNSSVYKDMARILDLAVDEEGRPSPELELELKRLHEETATALEIILTTGQFKPGVYVTSSPYKSDWKPLAVMANGGTGSDLG